MTLQTSGAISLSQVQSEFGGSNPVSMSEYYRGGAYVPTTVTQAAGNYTSYFYNSSYSWSAGLGVSITWNGTQVHNNINTSNTTTSLSTGGYTYQRGSFQSSSTSGGKLPITTSRYQVRRRLNASTITVNTGVPSSGTIDMADFYGGRNS